MQKCGHHGTSYIMLFNTNMGFPSPQLVKNLPAMQETAVWFLGGADPLECIGYPLQCSWGPLVAQIVKNLPAVLETWV